MSDTATDGPEFRRLSERLFGDPKRKLLNFNVWWGPDAHKLSVEERCAEVNKMFDAVDAGHSRKLDFGDSKRPRRNIREYLKAINGDD
jgi:hypothetical protein